MFSLIGKVVFGSSSGGGAGGAGGVEPAAALVASAKASRAPPEDRNTAFGSSKPPAAGAQEQPKPQPAPAPAPKQQDAVVNGECPLYEQGMALMAELRPYLVGDGVEDAAAAAASPAATKRGRGRPRKSDGLETAAITPVTLAAQASRLRRVAEPALLQGQGAKPRPFVSAGWDLGVTSPELQAAKSLLRPTGRRLTHGPLMKEEEEQQQEREEQQAVQPTKRGSTGAGGRGKRKR